MTTYTNDEYSDILTCYGYCNYVSAYAYNEYITRYTGRRMPNVSVFDGVYRRLRETGTVSRRRRTDLGRPRVIDDDKEQNNEILDDFDWIQPLPLILLPVIWDSRNGKYGLPFIHRSYPYHYTPVHAIEEGDPMRRLDFCRFMLNADVEDPTYLKNILWTDESKFDKDGITNCHNAHYWAPKELQNPNKRVKGSQRRFSLNVWMDIISNHLIGPYFLHENLNGEHCENFLRRDLSDLLDDLPLNLIRDMWFNHDGYPAHFRRSVRMAGHQLSKQMDWLDEVGLYPGQPAPNPHGFYVWEHMKSLVYSEPNPILSVEVLRDRILNAANEMRRTLTTGVVKSRLRKRMRRCVQNGGGHVEHEI